MSPGSWMVDWATMVGSGGQESFLCRHCWSTALTFVKGALQSLRQLHWALATGCQSCRKKSQSFYYLRTCQLRTPGELPRTIGWKKVQLTLGCTAFLRNAPGRRLWVLWGETSSGQNLLPWMRFLFAFLPDSLGAKVIKEFHGSDLFQTLELRR